MKDTPFEQELRALVEQFEPTPPPSVWKQISWTLRKPGFLSGGIWLSLALAAVLIVSFTYRESSLVSTPESPERLILLIDTSFCKDGSFWIDTVFQDLPAPIEKQQLDLSKPSQLEQADPSSILPAPQARIMDSTRFKAGQKIFAANCQNCHSLDPSMTLASLHGVTEKYKKQWLFSIASNPHELLKDGDPMAQKLLDGLDAGQTHSFPHLKEEALEDLYYYMEEQALLD